MQRQLLQEGRYKPQDGNLQAVLRGIEPPEGLPPAEIQREGLAVPTVNPAFVSAYDLYLRTDLKIGRSTVTRMMGYLHRVLKSAINSGHLRQDPFVGYTFDYVPIVPKFLSEKELKRMIATPCPNPT